MVATQIAVVVIGIERGDGLTHKLDQIRCATVSVERPAAVAEQHTHARDAASVHRFGALEALRQGKQVCARPRDVIAWPASWRPAGPP